MVKRREEEKILDVSASMQGSLVFSDPVNLRINGKFEGNLTTKGNLIIGERAQVNAQIAGENITISGKVKGKIKATSIITFTSTAYVWADIETSRIAIQEGAVFNGNCKMLAGKMSLADLCDYLSVEEEKVREWVNSGKIPVQREGQNLWFDRREVEAWLNSEGG